jgi:hypothetical protein
MPLVIILFAAYVIATVAVDGIYAARGEDSPRWRRRLARAEARAAKGGGQSPDGPPRYGSRDYFRDLGAAFWSNRRDRLDARRAGRPEDWASQPGPIRTAGAKVADATRGAVDAVRPVRDDEATPEPVEAAPTADGPIPTCEHCGQRMVNQPPHAWDSAWGRVPEWSHEGREPFCKGRKTPVGSAPDAPPYPTPPEKEPEGAWWTEADEATPPAVPAESAPIAGSAPAPSTPAPASQLPRIDLTLPPGEEDAQRAKQQDARPREQAAGGRPARESEEAEEEFTYTPDSARGFTADGARHLAREFGLCIYPVPTGSNGLCCEPVVEVAFGHGNFGWPVNTLCSYHTSITRAAQARQTARERAAKDEQAATQQGRPEGDPMTTIVEVRNHETSLKALENARDIVGLMDDRVQGIDMLAKGLGEQAKHILGYFQSKQVRADTLGAVGQVVDAFNADAVAAINAHLDAAKAAITNAENLLIEKFGEMAAQAVAELGGDASHASA